jgi:hypothetical protein
MKRQNVIENHTEKIICPQCGLGQMATVLHTVPHWTFIHTCIKCKELIMESDWKLLQPVTK